jgi:hypothetical protein
VPVSDRFSLFAKLGVASYDSQVDFGFDAQREHQSDLSYAAGGELSLAEHGDMRIEFAASTAATATSTCSASAACIAFDTAARTAGRM